MAVLALHGHSLSVELLTPLSHLRPKVKDDIVQLVEKDSLEKHVLSILNKNE